MCHIRYFTTDRVPNERHIHWNGISLGDERLSANRSGSRKSVNRHMTTPTRVYVHSRITAVGEST